MFNNLLSVAFFKLIGMLASFGVLLVLSRFYGASSVGGYSVLIAILTFGSLIVGFGLPEFALRESAALYGVGRMNDIPLEISRLTIVVFVNTLVFVFVLPTFIQLFDTDVYLSSILDSHGIMIVVIFLMAISYIFANVFKAINQVQLGVFLRETLNPMLLLLLLIASAVYAYFFGFNDDHYILEIVLVGAVTVFISSAYFIWTKLGFLLTSKLFSQLYSYWPKSIPFLFLSLVVWGNSSIDILMLGSLRGATEAGKYTVSARLSAMLGLIIIISNNVIAPKLSQLFATEEMAAFKEIAQKSTFYLGIAALFAFAGICAFSELILSVFGDEFSGDSWLLIVLSFSQAVNVAVGPVGYIIIASRHEKLFGFYSFLALLVNMILNYFLIIEYGALGAAFATAISLVLLNMFCLFLVKWKLNFFTVSIWL